MNRIIKQASVIGLLVLAFAMAANAQVSQQYRANIPFDFEAGGKHYEAGKYSVGPLSGSSSIAIRNIEKGDMRLLGANSLGGTNDWDNPGTLTFRKVNGQYRLNQITTATFQMELRPSKKERVLARNSSSATEVVAIQVHD